MPMCFIEAPQGIRIDAKRKMVEDASAALEEAYQLGDTRVFLREYLLENVAQDGHLQSEIRPVCFVEGPRLAVGLKRNMVKKIHAAVADACQAIVNVDEIMILINEYPLDNAASGGRLQAERTEIVETLRKANG